HLNPRRVPVRREKAKHRIACLSQPPDCFGQRDHAKMSWAWVLSFFFVAPFFHFGAGGSPAKWSVSTPMTTSVADIPLLVAAIQIWFFNGVGTRIDMRSVRSSSYLGLNVTLVAPLCVLRMSQQAVCFNLSGSVLPGIHPPSAAGLRPTAAAGRSAARILPPSRNLSALP